MTFDELHRKSLYFGSAAAAGVLLALLSSPHWYSTSPRYAYVQQGASECLEDVNSGTFVPVLDGAPVCHHAGAPATPSARSHAARRHGG